MKNFISFTDLASKEVLENSEPVEYISFEFDLSKNGRTSTYFAEIIRIEKREVIVLHLPSINHYLLLYSELLEQFTDRDLSKTPQNVYIIDYSISSIYAFRVFHCVGKITQNTSMDEIINYLNN